MPAHSEKTNPLPDIKVFIRNTQGKYLAQDGTGLFFTDDRASAIILGYKSDRVPEQLEAIQRTQGVTLAADPVPPEEIYESCDRCNELFMPFMTYYDGKFFLCGDCRKLVRARKG